MEEHPVLLHSVETMNMVRSIQPDIIINDRLGHGTTDFMTPEQFVPKPDSYSSVHNFESCLTINGAWGHNKSEVNWKSPKEIIYELVQNASMGGNYLLNVGPMSNGKIDPVDTQILKGAGKWIHWNAEAIFGTQAGPVPQPDWGRITCKTLPNGNTRLYLHVFDWPRGSKSQPSQFAITVAGLENQSIQTYALTTIPRRFYSAEQNKGSIVIELTGRRPDIVNSVVVLDIEGSIRKTN
jgi:alpha-L-fucosidase